MTGQQRLRRILAFALLGLCLLALLLFSMKSGSISVRWGQLLRGLFVAYDEQVALVYDLRFPRILIALLAGAALSCSGVLLQAALKNPLADPGIIGISGGAAFASACVCAFFPALYFSRPLLSCLGGALAFLLIYSLAWRGGLDSVRILLIGVALSAVFTGLSELVGGMSSNGVSVTVSGLSQRTWSDVKMLAVYTLIGLLLALLCAPGCNLMQLEDQTVRALGVQVDALRLLLSAVAVILVSCTTAIVGVIGFLALLVPHVARRFMGSDHRLLLPFSALLGALTLLAADTAGRLLFAPYELSASMLMNIFGGIFFVFLLRREGNEHAD